MEKSVAFKFSWMEKVGNIQNTKKNPQTKKENFPNNNFTLEALDVKFHMLWDLY